MDAPSRRAPSGTRDIDSPSSSDPLQCRVHVSADRVSINTFQMSAVKQRWVIMTAIFSRRAGGRAGRTGDAVVSVVPSRSRGSVSKFQVIIQAGAGAGKASQYAASASLKGSSAREINVLLTQRPSLC